jgi:hypothetical protein
MLLRITAGLAPPATWMNVPLPLSLTKVLLTTVSV